MQYFRHRFVEDLNEEGDIEIRGIVFKRNDILKTMDEEAHTTIFNDWVDQTISESIDRTREFLTETSCLDRFRQMCFRHRRGNIVPFIGAGMSVPSGFLLWGDFLKSLIQDAPEIHHDVDKYITSAQYEEAAQLVANTLGNGVLTEEIHNRLGAHLQRACGPVNLLPMLFEADVITTNFDYVLSKAYADAGKQFQGEFCGVQLREALRRLTNNPHSLLRLHGAAEAAEGRVLTMDEYRRHYENDGVLTDVLSAIIGIRGVLFIGCSLQSDRTYHALVEMKARAKIEPSPHYAFLPLPQSNRLERRRFLEAAGIHPIYYPPGDHEQAIEDLLITMQQGGLRNE